MTTIYHTPISVGAPVNASVVNAPLSQLDSAINNLNTSVSGLSASVTNILNGATPFVQLNLGATTTLTIAAGAITVSRTRHLVDTEAAAALDQLDTINGSADGDVLRIQVVSAARVVQVRHNVGNIYLAGEADIYLDDVRKALELVYDSTNSRWTERIQSPVVKGVISTTPFTALEMRMPDSIISSSGGFAGNNMPFLSIQPRPDKRGRFAEYASAAAYASDGMAAGTNAGAGALTNSNQADSVYVNQAIANVAGTFGGRRSSTFNLWRRQYNPYFAALMRTDPTITNIRFWIGITQAQVTNVDALAINTAFMGFRYSTVAADPAWMAVCADSSGAAQTNLTTGVGISASTAYLFEVYVDSSNGIVYFMVNRSTPVSIATNLPAVGTDLGWTVSAITTTATAKNILISRVYGDFN